MGQVTCKNCGNIFEGNYCNLCRQSANTERITFHEILHHLPHALFHTDKGLLHTAKELTLHPGSTIRDYLKGKRIEHFNPFLFVILLGSLVSFLFAAFHIKLINKEIDIDSIEQFNAVLSHKYFAITGIGTIAVLTITDYFFHFKKKFTFPELLISNAFQVGQSLLFLIAAFPLFYLQSFIEEEYGIHIILRPFIKLCLLIYLFVVRYQFYEAKHNYWLITKIVIQLVVAYALVQFVLKGLVAGFL